jgi:hypothetical protein
MLAYLGCDIGIMATGQFAKPFDGMLRLDDISALIKTKTINALPAFDLFPPAC